MQRLGEDVTMFSGPGGAWSCSTAPDGKFVVDTFVAPGPGPRLKEALDGPGQRARENASLTPTGTSTTPTTTLLFAPAGATVPRARKTQKKAHVRAARSSGLITEDPERPPARRLAFRPLRRWKPYRSRPSLPVTSCKPMGETLVLQTCFLPRTRTRTSTFILNRLT